MATKKEVKKELKISPDWEKQIEINKIALDRTDDLKHRIGQLALIVDGMHDRMVSLESIVQRLRTRIGI